MKGKRLVVRRTDPNTFADLMSKLFHSLSELDYAVYMSGLVNDDFPIEAVMEVLEVYNAITSVRSLE